MYENARITTNHDEIRKWIEEHGGIPSHTVNKITPDEDVGVLRIVFKGDKHTEEMISMNWNEFFTMFDQAHLAFLYNEKLAKDKTSKFYKFISCDGE